jgi:hypothetical protein
VLTSLLSAHTHMHTQLGLINSDGSSGSDMSAAGVSASPIGASVAAGYSPFMGAPWGNSLGLMPGGESAGPTGPAPLELPMSPMSPGARGVC